MRTLVAVGALGIALAASASGGASQAYIARVVFASDRGLAVSGDIYVAEARGRRDLARHPGVDRTPVPSPDGSRIAFDCADRKGVEDGYRGICVMARDGTGQRVLAARGTGATWAPGGTRLAYAAVVDNASRVYVVGIGGRVRRQLVEGALPAWSPRSGLIAYVADDRLFVVDADSGAVRPLAPDVRVAFSPPDWSPDGAQLAFVGASEGSRRSIYVAAINGASVVRVSRPPGPCDGDTDPQWSPDHTRIVFSRDLWTTGNVCRSERAALILAEADGSGEEPLTAPPEATYDTAPAWSADASEVAFVRSVAVRGVFRERRIHVVRVRERTLRAAPADPRERVETGPVWLPGGGLLYSSVLENDLDLYSVREDGTGLRRLTDTAVDERRPLPSPDGTRLLFTRSVVRNGKQTTELFVARADGRGARQLTDNDATEDWLSWSADGSRVLYTRVGDGIFAVDVAVGRETRVAEAAGVPLAEAVLSPDGGRLAGSIDVGGEPRIAVFDLDRRRLRTIGRRCTSSPSWSPDGRTLAGIAGLCVAARGCPATIVTMTPRGSAYRPIASGECGSRPQWSPDGSELVWSVYDDVYAASVASRRVRRLTDGPGSVRHVDPSWLPSAPATRS